MDQLGGVESGCLGTVEWAESLPSLGNQRQRNLHRELAATAWLTLHLNRSLMAVDPAVQLSTTCRLAGGSDSCRGLVLSKIYSINGIAIGEKVPVL